MDITGILYKKFQTREFKNNFTKREFILEDDINQEYPQYITFQLIKDRCTLLDKCNEGDTLKVYFNLQGREWTNPEGKVVYFNSIVAWKIEGGSAKESKENKEPDLGLTNNDVLDLLPAGDDLPF
jgi:hypothetical protein